MSDRQITNLRNSEIKTDRHQRKYTCRGGHIQKGEKGGRERKAGRRFIGKIFTPQTNKTLYPGIRISTTVNLSENAEYLKC